MDPRLTPVVRALWAEPRVGTLGVVRADGSPHLTPVRSMLDLDGGRGRVLVLTRPDTVKARIVRRTGRASVAEHTPHADWATLEGPTSLTDDAIGLAHARSLYAARYGEPDGWGTQGMSPHVWPATRLLARHLAAFSSVGGQTRAASLLRLATWGARRRSRRARHGETRPTCWSSPSSGC